MARREGIKDDGAQLRRRHEAERAHEERVGVDAEAPLRRGPLARRTAAARTSGAMRDERDARLPGVAVVGSGELALVLRSGRSPRSRPRRRARSSATRGGRAARRAGDSRQARGARAPGRSRARTLRLRRGPLAREREVAEEEIVHHGDAGARLDQVDHVECERASSRTGTRSPCSGRRPTGARCAARDAERRAQHRVVDLCGVST